jgi:hypothetical protein
VLDQGLYRYRGAAYLRSLVRAVACAVLLASLASCSLVSIKSPEKPLSARDLNARLLTHEYSAHFIAAVEQAPRSVTAARRPMLRIASGRRAPWKYTARA